MSGKFGKLSQVMYTIPWIEKDFKFKNKLPNNQFMIS